MKDFGLIESWRTQDRVTPQEAIPQTEKPKTIQSFLAS